MDILDHHVRELRGCIAHTEEGKTFLSIIRLAVSDRKDLLEELDRQEGLMDEMMAAETALLQKTEQVRLDYKRRIGLN